MNGHHGLAETLGFVRVLREPVEDRHIEHHVERRPASLGEVSDGGGEVDENRQGRISLGTHEVGRNGETFPPDAGVPLPGPNSALFFDNFHIHASGVPGSERVGRLDVGLWLHPKGYAPKYKNGRASFGANEMQINPLQGSQRLDAYMVLDSPRILLNFEPHMHAAGVRMCLEAIVRNVAETLNCAGYDHNWVRNYQYDENSAPLLPKGTILHAIGWLDNTSKNGNVLEPRNMASFGSSSVSNMFYQFGRSVNLTDAQYQEELTKRREALRLTEEEIVGCPDCYAAPGKLFVDPRQRLNGN
jgi:hypothetical protein